jgi:hypothetical protein
LTHLLRSGSALALVAAFFMLGQAAGASAASVPSWGTPCSADIDVAACERLTYIASEISTIDDSTAATAGNSGAPVSGTVALDANASDRLDLAWWGVWAVAGLLLALIVAPMFTSSFRFLRP